MFWGCLRKKVGVMEGKRISDLGFGIGEEEKEDEKA